LDAPGGTVAGGLNDMVAWAAARMLAYERPIRLNERLDIANECTHDWKQSHATTTRNLQARTCIY
jgi:hypothetical protein